MANVTLFDQTGKQAGEVVLNDAIFGIEPNQSVVFDVIISNVLAFVKELTQLKTAQLFQVADANHDLAESELEWVNWSKKPETALGIYEYVNTHRYNRTDYFRLKPNGNPNQYFPLDQNSSNDWEFLSSNKAEAIKKNECSTFHGYIQRYIRRN